MATGKTLASLLSTPSNSMPVVRLEGSQPEALPAEQVFGYRQRDPWAVRRMCGVSHHVASEWFDKRDTRILAAAGAVLPQLVIRFGLQCDTEPLDSVRITGLIEQNSRYADAGVVAPPDQSREEVELTIRTTHSGWVQDAFGLQGIARFRFHHQSQDAAIESHSCILLTRPANVRNAFICCPPGNMRAPLILLPSKGSPLLT